MSSPAPEYTEHGEDWSPVQNEVKTNPDLAAPADSPLSFHPDIRSPGLESVWSGDQGKEVVSPEQAMDYPQGKIPAGPTEPDEPIRPKKRICGMPRALFLILFALLFILAVGIGVGLGVGLGTKHHSSSNATTPSVNPQYLSKIGAFNGTGLAIASYSFGTGGYGVINVYFQHWTGQIRKLELLNDGAWAGGDETNIVAANARNGTPISAVAYAMDNIAVWHIFYIDTNNIIRERISDNTTNLWSDGPIGNLNLVAMDDNAVGLQACWYGSFYGTANYVHSPIPSTGSNTTSQDAVIGMHLWYGVDPVTMQEVTWTYNTSDWYLEGNFTANGHAGIGCYSWGPGSVTYLMLVNLDDTVQMLWKDLNTSVTGSPSHPTNVWVNSSVSIPNAMPNTSLGYTNYFYAQMNDGSIAGYNISFAAENSAILSSQNFEIPQKPLPGTHFSVTAIPNVSGGNSLIVFDQVNGSDITENTRDLSSGQWSYASLPIPNT